MTVHLPGSSIAAERCLATGSYFVAGRPSPAWDRRNFIPVPGSLSRGAAGAGGAQPGPPAVGRALRSGAQRPITGPARNPSTRRGRA